MAEIVGAVIGSQLVAWLILRVLRGRSGSDSVKPAVALSLRIGLFVVWIVALALRQPATEPARHRAQEQTSSQQRPPSPARDARQPQPAAWLPRDAAPREPADDRPLQATEPHGAAGDSDPPTAAPDSAVSSGFHCFDELALGRTTGGCFGSADRCRAAAKNSARTSTLGLLRADAVEAAPCYRQPKAACVSAFFVMENSRRRFCFASMRACSERRDQLRLAPEPRDIQKVSRCAIEETWAEEELDLSRNWWCFSRQSSILGDGACFATEGSCTAARERILGKIKEAPFSGVLSGPPSECAPQPRAACFSAFAVMQDAVVAHCYPTMTGCTAYRSGLKFSSRGDFKKISMCRVTESLSAAE